MGLVSDLSDLERFSEKEDPVSSFQLKGWGVYTIYCVLTQRMVRIVGIDRLLELLGLSLVDRFCLKNRVERNR